MVLKPHPRTPWVVLGAFTVALAAVGVWQQRLIESRAAAWEPPAKISSPPPDPRQAEAELASLRKQAMEAEALRAEHESLRQELTLRPQSEKPVEKPKSSESWTNAGRNTPVDTLQTIIWAAVSGEISHLRGALLLEGAAQTAADALFAELSPEERAEYRDPATVVAVMLSGQMPLNLRQPQVLEEIHESPQRVRLRLQLQRDRGAQDQKTYRFPEEKVYHFQHDGTGWRAVVPVSVVEQYHELLRAPQDSNVSDL